MRWLVTGGCGFLGANLVDALLSNAEEVIVVDNLSRAGARANLDWLTSRYGRDWRMVEADIRDASAMESLVEQTAPHTIAHPGQVAMTTSLEDPRYDFEINALGTLNLLEAARLKCPEAILIYPSSNKVYGSLEQLRHVELETRYVLPDYPQGIDESLPIEGHSPYGCSKLAAEQYVRDYHRIYGLRSIVFRHSSMYGGRQYATYDQGWIGWFCTKALEMRDPNAGAFTISGDGKQVRDVLHADDVVAAYLLAARNADRIAGRIYNIGGGPSESLSLLELFSMLEGLTGDRMRFRRLDWRPGDQKVFVADISNIAQDLAWTPAVKADQGITRMLEWSRAIAADSVRS
jgi:CDP-paratose 2-epimerase